MSISATENLTPLSDLLLVKIPHAESTSSHVSMGLRSQGEDSRGEIGMKLPNGMPTSFADALSTDGLHLSFDLVKDTVAVTTDSQSVVFPIDHDKMMGTEIVVGEGLTITFESPDDNMYVVDIEEIAEFVLYGGAQFIDLPRLEEYLLVKEAEELLEKAVEGARFAQMNRPPKNARKIEVVIAPEDMTAAQAEEMMRRLLPEDVVIPQLNGASSSGLRWKPDTQPTTITELRVDGCRLALATCTPKGSDQTLTIVMLPEYRGGLGVQWINPETGKAAGVVLRKEAMKKPLGLGETLSGVPLCDFDGSKFDLDETPFKDGEEWSSGKLKDFVALGPQLEPGRGEDRPVSKLLISFQIATTRTEKPVRDTSPASQTNYDLAR